MLAFLIMLLMHKCNSEFVPIALLNCILRCTIKKNRFAMLVELIQVKKTFINFLFVYTFIVTTYICSKFNKL